jgi:hypothetical protein
MPTTLQIFVYLLVIADASALGAIGGDDNVLQVLLIKFD